jgi:hypothetical protein
VGDLQGFLKSRAFNGLSDNVKTAIESPSRGWQNAAVEICSRCQKEGLASVNNIVADVVDNDALLLKGFKKVFKTSIILYLVTEAMRDGDSSSLSAESTSSVNGSDSINDIPPSDAAVNNTDTGVEAKIAPAEKDEAVVTQTPVLAEQAHVDQMNVVNSNLSNNAATEINDRANALYGRLTVARNSKDAVELVAVEDIVKNITKYEYVLGNMQGELALNDVVNNVKMWTNIIGPMLASLDTSNVVNLDVVNDLSHCLELVYSVALRGFSTLNLAVVNDSTLFRSFVVSPLIYSFLFCRKFGVDLFPELDVVDFVECRETCEKYFLDGVEIPSFILKVEVRARMNWKNRLEALSYGRAYPFLSGKGWLFYGDVESMRKAVIGVISGQMKELPMP